MTLVSISSSAVMKVVSLSHGLSVWSSVATGLRGAGKKERGKKVVVESR
jgi:hypothetical protein